LVKFLGRVLFPDQAPSQQRASILTVLWSIAAGILTGGVIIAVMLMHGLR
jgi:hypothetical protein